MEFTAPNNVPDGVYGATLMTIEQREPGENSLTQKPYLRWTFEVYTEEDPDGIELVKNTSQSFGPKSNARKFVQSLLGRQIQPGEQINMADYLPLDCQVVVKIDQESGYSRIEDVLGAKKTRKKGAGEGVAL